MHIEPQRLVLIGNGFDLAHGLKTSYRDFLNWYMCNAFQVFVKEGFFEDRLITIERKFPGMSTSFGENQPKDVQEVIELISCNEYQRLNYKSQFCSLLIDLLNKGWVDIEREYFRRLISLFKLNSLTPSEKAGQVSELNQDFDHIITLLTEYITHINSHIKGCKELPLGNTRLNFHRAFQMNDSSPITFLNFNYTETLLDLGYADEREIIHIHGRASKIKENPIIFGYGDETDPVYQEIEDSGENVYLEHVKSFAYFKTHNYNHLISFIDARKFDVYIFGLSCGLSDRILLSEIFEHKNCESIEVFYHRRADGSDNFKEITQEISRHFRPQNKGLFRRRMMPQDVRDAIPQQIC